MQTRPCLSRSNTPPRRAPTPEAEAPPDGKHPARAGRVQVVGAHPPPAPPRALVPAPAQVALGPRPREAPQAPPPVPVQGPAQAPPPPPPLVAAALGPANPPWHAHVQECLFRITDNLTFRGTLAPLLSSCMKWAVAGKAGTGNVLEGSIEAAIGASLLQALAGACLPGDREHGFSWMGTLRPSPDLEPPPSVARWSTYAPREDQDLLRRIDRERKVCDQGPPHLAGRQEEYRKRLDEAEALLKQRLLRDRDWTDLCSAAATIGPMVMDMLALSAAGDDRAAGRLDGRAYYGIWAMLLVTLMLDVAAGLWQMRSRRPRPEDYPRPAPPFRGSGPAGAPAPPAARPGAGPGPAAGPPRSGPR